MKFFKLFNILSTIPFIRPSLFPKKPLCKDCKYLIGNVMDKKCSRFSTYDLVTGKENYEFASSVRRDANKCGEDAKYFEKNHLKIFTVPYYFIIEFWPIFVGLSLGIILNVLKSN